MQKFLSSTLIVVVFLITTLPLLVFGDLFFPFITSKVFAFRFLIELGVILLLILAVGDKRYVPRVTPVTITFLFFLGVFLAADLFGLNPIRSIWSNFERMEGWVTLVHLFGAFLLFERVFSIHNFWNRWIQFSLGVSVLVGLHGVAQLVGFADIHQSTVRLDANFGNATYLAVYTLFHVFFASWMFFESRGFFARSAYIFIGILNIAILYFTSTRGALIGLFAGAAVSLFVYALIKKSKKILLVLIVFALTGVSLFAVLVANKNSSFVAQNGTLVRIANISLEEGETRFKIWSIAQKGFLERPVLGWGQGNFNLVFSKYYDPSLYAQEPWFDRAHNVLMDWLVAGGVLGLSSYLLLFGSAIFFVFKLQISPKKKAVIVGLLSAYFVNNLFVFDNLTSYVLFVFVLAYISANFRKEYRLPQLRINSSVAASLTIIIGLYVVYAVNVPALNANGALLRALNPQYATSERQEFFREALSYNSFASQEIREQMVQLAIFAVRQEGISIETKIALLADAANEMEKQAMLMPESARIHMLYGLMHRLLGSNERAYEILSHARNLSPKKQSILFEYAFAAESLGKKQEALATLKEAYELDTSYEQARVLYEQAQERLSK